jgi:hypothetical protein
MGKVLSSSNRDPRREATCSVTVGAHETTPTDDGCCFDAIFEYDCIKINNGSIAAGKTMLSNARAFVRHLIGILLSNKNKIGWHKGENVPKWNWIKI